MLVNTILAAVGVAGVGFYLRFLVALSKESSRGLIGYLVRVRTHAHHEVITEFQSEEDTVKRAA
jgi:hypothetical protein